MAETIEQLAEEIRLGINSTDYEDRPFEDSAHDALNQLVGRAQRLERIEQAARLVYDERFDGVSDEMTNDDLRLAVILQEALGLYVEES